MFVGSFAPESSFVQEDNAVSDRDSLEMVGRHQNGPCTPQGLERV